MKKRESHRTVVPFKRIMACVLLGSLLRKIALLAFLAASLWGGPESVQAAAVQVDGPGLVLVIDGTDPDSSTGTFNIDATLPVAVYDFGFVNGGVYTPIALLPKGPASLYGTF